MDLLHSLHSLQIQDVKLFEDLLNFRSYDVHRLLKRLDLIHKSVSDAEKKGHIASMSENLTIHFLKRVIYCYCKCIESIKLARSVEKLLQPWKSTHKKLIQNEFIEFLSSITSVEDSHIISITAVANLLEQNAIVIEVVGEMMVTVLAWVKTRLDVLIVKLPSELTTLQIGSLYAYVKIVLQLFQSFPQQTLILENHQDQLNRPELHYLEAILEAIYVILNTDGYTTDCVQLAGTTYSFVISSMSDPRTAVSAFWSTFLSLSNTGSTFSVNHLRKSHNQDVATSQLLTDIHNLRKSLGPLCLVKGVVACCTAQILCYHDNSQSHDSSTFILSLFPLINEYCHGPLKFHYHSFSLMNSWFRKFLLSIPEFIKHGSYYRNRINEIFLKTINLIFLNWDSPVEDVAEIVGEIFQVLLECWKTVATKSTTDVKDICKDLPEEVLSKIQNTPWYVKGKYRILAILLPYMDQEEILLKNHLLQCMSTNYLAPCGADVYKAFIKEIGKGSNQEAVVEIWRSRWLKTVMLGLTSSNSLLQNNVNHYWVQSTSKVLPAAGRFLLEYLSDELHLDTPHFPRQQVLHAWVVVSKVIRNSTGKEVEESDLLREALYSSVEDTRAEAISLICCTLRKAEALSERDGALLMEVLPENLKIDSAPFRQHLGANMKKLLIRVRDSCLAGLKVKNLSVLDSSLAFVEWLHQLCVDNLMAGACYQRRKACLDLLTILYETLVYQEDARQRKSYTPESTQKLVTYARGQGLWNFFSTDNTICLLHCLCDGADEDICPVHMLGIVPDGLLKGTKLQEMSTGLLIRYFDWPLLPSSTLTDVTQEDLACHLLTHAITLCNSPKAYESQSGALLFKIVFTKYVIEHRWMFDCKPSSMTCRVLSKTAQDDDHPAVPFLKTFTSYIKESLETSKTNVVLASKTSPIHGFITACTKCITDVPDLMQQNSFDLYSVAKELISLGMEVIDTMLKVMARDSENEQCPSFGEIGVALESWIAESQKEYSESTSLSADHQYLLSWCWINIKESCLSLGHLSHVLVQRNKETDINTLQDISQVFLNVLTNCRHRGVLEGCRSAFIRFCSSLFMSSHTELNQMPEHILSESLSSLTAKATSTSTTRKSAGLPIIIQTIVTCEKNYKKNKLLQMALKDLFHITSLPLGTQLDDKFDLPQVHGLNILKSLYGDSSLTGSLMPYVSDAVRLVVESFGSPAWAIRNAATRLFSSLVTRIFGHKKSTDDVTWNTISFQEFAAHYPELPPFMLQQLDQALKTDISAIDKLHPSLFPVLTLLANLGPTETVQQEHRLIREFQSQIQHLLASPVYYLRHLTASAFVALLTLQSVKDSLLDILKDIPDCPCQSHMYNRVHGTLLCVEKTLTSHAIRADDISEVTAVILKKSWLFTEQNVCPMIKDSCLRVLTKLLPKCSQPMKSTGFGLVKTMWELKGHRTNGVCLGNGVFTKNIVECLLTSPEGDEGDLVSFVQDILQESNMDAKLSCVFTLKKLLQSGRWSESHWHNIQVVLAKLLKKETYPPLLTDCLSLLVSIHFTHGTNPDTAKQLYDYACCHGKSVEGKSSVEAGLLPAAAIGIQESMNRLKPLPTTALQNWCDQLWSASEMTGDEHFRLAAGQCLLITGHSIITFYELARDTVFQKCIVKLFQTVLNLIQDDDTEVRTLAMKFIPQLQYRAKSIEFGSIQCNKGYQLMFEFLHTTYWWSEVIVTSLVEMLYKPRDVRTCIEGKLTVSHQHLFEQEDNSFFAESIFNRIEVCNSLKYIVRCCMGHQLYKSLYCLQSILQSLCDDLEFIDGILKKYISGKPVYNLGMDTAVLSAISGCVLLGVVVLDSQKVPQLHSIPDIEHVRTHLQSILSNPDLSQSFRQTVDRLMLSESSSDQDVVQSSYRPTWL